MCGQWHMMTVNDVVGTLQSDAVRGLDEREAGERLARFGPNELAVKNSFIPLRFITDRFKSPVYLLLAAVAVVAGMHGDHAGAAAMLLFILVNVLIRGILNWRSANCIAGLRYFSSYYARVFRDAKEKKIKNAGLVPGDIVLIRPGDRVPADLRLIDAAGLEINEMIFTGKDTPAVKKTDPLSYSVMNRDNIGNCVFMGTWVIRGTGRGIVVATGTATQAGRMAAINANKKAEKYLTEKQARLVNKGRQLAAVYFLLCVILVLAGVYFGYDLFPVVAAAVCLFAVVSPKELPEVLGFFFGAAVQRAAGNGVIVQLPAEFEDLHRSEIICVSKTGMITQDRMMA